MSSSSSGVQDLRRRLVRLPVGATVGEILRIAWHGRRRWVRLVVLPFIVQWAILIPFNGSPLAAALSSLLYVPAATAWIRNLNGASASAVALRYHWGSNEGWYILRFLELYLAISIVAACAILVFIPSWELTLTAIGGTTGTDLSGSQFPPFVGAVVFVVAGISLVGLLLWLIADFVMVLPAAAAGDDSSFRASATLTRGHRWQIVAIGIGTAVAFVLTSLLLSALILLLALVVIALIGGGIAALGGSAAGFDGIHLGQDAIMSIVTVSIASLIVAVAAALSTLLHATAYGCVYRHLKNAALDPR